MEPENYRAIIKHLHLSGLNPLKIHQILQNQYGDSSPSYSTVKNWAARFKTGHESLVVEPRPGRPQTAASPNKLTQIVAKYASDQRVLDTSTSPYERSTILRRLTYVLIDRSQQGHDLTSFAALHLGSKQSYDISRLYHFGLIRKQLSSLYCTHRLN